MSPYYGRDAVTILPVILHPKGRGSIRLKSSNPTDHPLIDPKYFENPDDVIMLVESIQMIRKMLSSSPELRQLDFSLPDVPFPKCRQEFEISPFGDDYW